MAWEWSHTQEAYAAAQANLRALPDGELATILAEWRASEPREYGGYQFNPHHYRREIRRAYSLLRRGFREQVEDEVWDRAQEQATCDNGGWNAWLCPFGCGCHCVPFDRDGEGQA